MSALGSNARAGHAPSALALVCVAITGCAATPRSTRLTPRDIQEMSVRVAQSLATSEALQTRSPQSEPWSVTVSEVQNLSHDVISEGERWGVMAGIVSSLPVRELWDQRRVRLLLPAERVASLRRSLGADADSFAAQRRPTHVIRATFRSLPRSDGRASSELYDCLFEMVELDSGRLVWRDHVEYKREASGHVWD